MLQFCKKALIFARRQQRSSHCLLNFLKGNISNAQKGHIWSHMFRIFLFDVIGVVHMIIGFGTCTHVLTRVS